MLRGIYFDSSKKDPREGLDDTTITAEAEYSISFTQQQKAFWLSLYYSGNNSLLYVNRMKIYEFKALILCLSNFLNNLI